MRWHVTQWHDFHDKSQWIFFEEILYQSIADVCSGNTFLWMWALWIAVQLSFYLTCTLGVFSNLWAFQRIILTKYCLHVCMQWEHTSVNVNTLQGQSSAPSPHMLLKERHYTLSHEHGCWRNLLFLRKMFIEIMESEFFSDNDDVMIVCACLADMT